MSTSYRAILGKLAARTAIHIGTGQGRDVTDDPCRRDAAGDYIIPGTAIAGALRAIATRLAPRMWSEVCMGLSKEKEVKSQEPDGPKPCGCRVCHLFGDINPGERSAEATGGRASRLCVAHAKAAFSKVKTAQIRDGVGIDRASRTSARAGSVKFDLEALPRGAEFQLRLELEEADEDDERLLAAALGEWQAGRVWLGGRVSRGLGAFDLNDVKLVERDLSASDSLLAFLQSDKPWEGAGETANWLATRLGEARQKLRDIREDHTGTGKSFATIRFSLKLEGPFLTNDNTVAVRSGFDHAPLLTMPSQDGRPILTGASLRGALRSQAERIARTLTTLDVERGDDFLAKCPACNPLESRHEEPLASCDTLLRNKANVPDEEEISDCQLCLGCLLFGSARRGSRLIVEDSEGESVARKVLDFLAIDRFTGGGKEGAKFDALALWNPAFPVRLHLENPARWELGWLALALRDLADGMLSFGSGASKGMGRATLDSFTAQIGFLSDRDWRALSDAPTPDAGDTGLYRCVTLDWEQWLKAGGKWVESFNTQCKEFNRQADLRLEKDTYFDGNIPALYAKEAYQWLLKP